MVIRLLYLTTFSYPEQSDWLQGETDQYIINIIITPNPNKAAEASERRTKI